MFQIQKGKPEANVPRTIRFTEPLFEELNETAAMHEVSFNALVLQCCRYALDQMAKATDIIEK
ncbi:MAG: hypothetical protein FWD25_07720 [Clostridia bacterium]|nr:hypothetical protein [Clostridia bacterium]